jgi:hypothetical protein
MPLVTRTSAARLLAAGGSQRRALALPRATRSALAAAVAGMAAFVSPRRAARPPAGRAVAVNDA